MTHQELRARLTQRELIAWRILEEVDPWGEKRDDWRTAMLASIMVNLQLPADKKLKVSDFLLSFSPTSQPPTELSPDESVAAIAELNRMLGGRDLRQANEEGTA